MNTPKVTIGMPAFNAGEHLAEAIDSLLAQSFGDFELIVIDDGSSDHTHTIATRIAAKDSRIRVLRNKRNRGLVFTRNRLLKEIRTPYFAAADADDIFYFDRIEKQIHFLEANQDVGVLGGNVDFTSTDTEDSRDPSHLYLDDARIRFFLNLGPCIWNTVTMYRKEHLEAVGGYRNGLDRGAEDYDLWCRLLPKTRFANLPDRLATVRLHRSSVTAGEAATQNNIFVIAQPLLSEYLRHEVTLEEAKDLILLFWRGLGTRPDISAVLENARRLHTAAQILEDEETYREFARRLQESLFQLAEAEVYVNRSQSAEAMKLALKIAPSRVWQMSFAKYSMRLATPKPIRQLLKSAMAPANQ